MDCLADVQYVIKDGSNFNHTSSNCERSAHRCHLRINKPERGLLRQSSGFDLFPTFLFSM